MLIHIESLGTLFHCLRISVTPGYPGSFNVTEIFSAEPSDCPVSSFAKSAFPLGFLSNWTVGLCNSATYSTDRGIELRLCVIDTPICQWGHVYMQARLLHVHLFATSWTVAHQAPLYMRFSRQEYWNGLPCLPLGDLPNPGIKPMSLTSPVLQADSLPLVPAGKAPGTR